MRTIRIADGPDEVHLQQLGRNENKRNQHILDRVAERKKRVDRKLKEYGFAANL
jgi:acyl-CoA dehydrogenase